ncbi:MAG TPA: hypothetical protein VIP05_21340 [Burkholderiaceae bacterium]
MDVDDLPVVLKLVEHDRAAEALEVEGVEGGDERKAAMTSGIAR